MSKLNVDHSYFTGETGSIKTPVYDTITIPDIQKSRIAKIDLEIERLRGRREVYAYEVAAFPALSQVDFIELRNRDIQTVDKKIEELKKEKAQLEVLENENKSL